MSENILVTVGIAAYNQKLYIKQCLDNILNQKTDFKFKILVNDDCSTDGTTDILNLYETKYPDKIKVIYHSENQLSKGVGIYKTFIFPNVQSKYIAICDGDDYWCDEYKLQKQVDFLESHPDYALCYHPAKMIYVDEQHEPVIIGKSTHANPQPYYDLLKTNYIPAGSVMYRFKYLKEELADYPDNIYPGDWYTHITVAKHGKIGYLPDVMYVYRWNNQGISHTTSDDPVKEIHLKYGVKEVNFSYNVWNNIKDQFPQYYQEIFIQTLKDAYFTYLQNKRFDELKVLQQNYSDYFKDISFNNFLKDEEINKFKNKYNKYKKLFNIFLIVSIVLCLINIGLVLLINK